MSSASLNEYHFGSVRLDGDGARRKPGSRLLRTLRLLEFLHSGRICNSAEPAEFCGVSVIYDEARGGYFVPHRLSLAPSELTFAEAAARYRLPAAPPARCWASAKPSQQRQKSARIFPSRFATLPKSHLRCIRRSMPIWRGRRP